MQNRPLKPRGGAQEFDEGRRLNRIYKIRNRSSEKNEIMRKPSIEKRMGPSYK